MLVSYAILVVGLLVLDAAQSPFGRMIGIVVSCVGVALAIRAEVERQRKG